MADDKNRPDMSKLIQAQFGKERAGGTAFRNWGGRGRPIFFLILIIIVTIFFLVPFIIGMWTSGFVDLNPTSLEFWLGLALAAGFIIVGGVL